MASKLQAAVALVRPSGNRNGNRSPTIPPSTGPERILVVWNRRYLGWTLPGGLVQPKESPEEAMWRELNEETGLSALDSRELYSAPVAKVLAPQRGEHVIVYAVDTWNGIESECEEGCPVTWMSVAEFLSVCPFRDFYLGMGNAVDELGWRQTVHLDLTQRLAGR